MTNVPANPHRSLLSLGLGPDPASPRDVNKIERRAAKDFDSGQVHVKPGGPQPRLEVEWHRRRDQFLDDLRAVLHGPWPKLPRRIRFHDPWRPRRYFAVWFSLSSLAHVIFLALPLPLWLAMSQPARLRGQPEVELTWSGPIKDLPALGSRSPAKRNEPKREPEPAPSSAPVVADPAPPRIERASRQTILAMPAQPNHPRQLLIQPAAAPEPPKILPPLPNIVDWARAPQPAKPRASISRETLARLLPKARKRRSVVEQAAPALPNAELRLGELSISSKAPEVARPRLGLPAASVPVQVQQRDLGDASAPPELGQSGLSGFGSGETGRGIIALSSNPAPAPPSLDVPLGNLAARVAASPLGPTPGAENGTLGATGKNPAGGNGSGAGGNGGAGGSGSGAGGSGGPTEIFISRGDPSRTSNVVGPGGGTGSGSGSGSGLGPSRAGSSPAGSPPRLSARDLAQGSGRGGLPPTPSPGGSLEGYAPARPEEGVLRQKRIYTVTMNMPNLTSVTGSWILRFAELDPEGKQSQIPSGELSSPEAIRKVDPKYPPALIEARIEGDVVLYAIIRKDGTVDSVQVLRSLEPELDRNAMSAFTRWQFWPAIKSGTPVDIEAVVTIPFRAFSPR